MSHPATPKIGVKKFMIGIVKRKVVTDQTKIIAIC